MVIGLSHLNCSTICKRNSISEKKGLTYIELIIGMTILLVGVGLLSTIYRFSRENIFAAKEKMAMATTAQNVAQVYLATNDVTKAVNEGKSHGFNSINLVITSGPMTGIKTVVITVGSEFSSDPSHLKYVKPYQLVFYMPE